MNSKAIKPAAVSVSTEEPCDKPVVTPGGIVMYNRLSRHGPSTLQYLRDLGLPDYTDLEGTGFADISSITRAILNPEEMERARNAESRFAEFTKTYEMTCGLQKNPHKALEHKMGASPRPLSESELREAFAWQKNIPTAKSIAKQQRRAFFNAECLPIMVMVFDRAQSHLDGVIRGRARSELQFHQEQLARFFKDDKSFLFQASGELRGLIKRYIYLKDHNFNEYSSTGGSLKSQLRGILDLD